MRIVTAAALLLVIAGPAHLRGEMKLSGQASVLANSFPNESRTPELRARIYAKEAVTIGPRLRFDIGGFAEGLLAGGPGKDRAGVAEFDEASIQLTLARVDLLAGFTRAVWGRLDELQPSDVINPLDLSKFFYESREAARMPVGLVRTRFHFGKSTAVELIAVPRFRQGRFDRLDEPSSPFNPASLPLRVVANRPAGGWEQMQGGGRLMASTKRVDWAFGAYRGFRPLPVTTLSYSTAGLAAAPVVAINVTQNFPRFTNVSGDFELALSKWTLRGETVVSHDSAAQARRSPVTATARTIQAGFGADRSIGGYRVLGELIWHHASFDTPSLPTDPLTAGPPVFERRSLTAVGIAERQFARATRLLRGFAIYDAENRNGLARGVAAISPREGWWLEGHAAWVSGRRGGLLGPFLDDDFFSVRLITYF